MRRMGTSDHVLQQEGGTLLGRVASLCRRVARARAPMTERQLAPTRRLDTSVRTRYRVSQSLQHTHIASQVLPETTEHFSTMAKQSVKLEMPCRADVLTPCGACSMERSASLSVFRRRTFGSLAGPFRSFRRLWDRKSHMQSVPHGKCMQEGGCCAGALPAAAEEAEDGLLAPGSGTRALLLCHAAQALVHAPHRQGCRLDQHRLQQQQQLAHFNRSAHTLKGMLIKRRIFPFILAPFKVSASNEIDSRHSHDTNAPVRGQPLYIPFQSLIRFLFENHTLRS